MQLERQKAMEKVNAEREKKMELEQARKEY
jgi:hypothetical protein